jgi:hypothetical protein
LLIGEFLRVNDTDSAYAANMAIVNNRYIYLCRVAVRSRRRAPVSYSRSAMGGICSPIRWGLTPISPSFVNIDNELTRR